jgi:N-acetylglucosamine kinase-like BadF-type ATPase
MSDQRYVVGMDGGGTKTAAVIADLAGNVLWNTVGGPANFQVIGVETSANTVLDMITQCCQRVGCKYESVASVVLGFTGAGRPSDQNRMRDGVLAVAGERQVALKDVIVNSDARIALEGAFRGNPGMILIAGTGSILFGKDAEDNIHRVGGWGRFIGDEGSGYDIGRRGLGAVTKHLDGRGDVTILTTLVADRFGLKDQPTIIAEVYKNNFDIASVALLVLEAADQQDSVCAEIVSRAVDELLLHIRTMLGKIDFSGAAKLAFVGSVLTHDNILSRMLRNEIHLQTPRVNLQEPECTPAYGAVLMALKSVAKSSRQSSRVT